MDKRYLKQTLLELATQAVPDDLDLWPAIRERLAHRPQRAPQTRPIPAARLSWLGIALAALLVLSLTAYATAPALSRLLQRDDRLKHTDLARLSQPLDLSQTIGPVTITLQWAYADADRVLIGYTLHSADGRRFEPYGETLTEATGIAFQWQGSYGAEGSFAPIFDAVSKPSTMPRSLHVRFTVYAREFVAPPSSPISSTTEAAGVTHVPLQPAPSNGALIGPFTFDFTLPVVK
jgi:hypothetical protein